MRPLYFIQTDMRTGAALSLISSALLLGTTFAHVLEIQAEADLGGCDCELSCTGVIGPEPEASGLPGPPG